MDSELTAIDNNTDGLIISTIQQTARHSAKYSCYLESLPFFRKAFAAPWIKMDSYEQESLLLQACYSDRYGNFPPNISPYKAMIKRNYKHGAGRILTKEKVIAEVVTNSYYADSSGNEDTSVISHRPSKSAVINELSTQHATTIIQNKKHTTPQREEYSPGIAQQTKRLYWIDPKRLDRLVEKVKKNWSLTLFISSPFVGCEEERRYFMESCFPALSSMCLAHGVFLSVVDMRWGITNEMSSTGKTIMACLDGIDRADIFLGYFGARYGSSKLLPHSEWIDEALDAVSNGLNSNYSYINQFYHDRSITEMEWQHAFLHDNYCNDVNKPVCYFLYRSSEYDTEMKQKAEMANDDYRLHAFQVENEPSAHAAYRLRESVSKHLVSTPCGANDKWFNAAVINDYSTPLEGAKIMEEGSLFLIKHVLSTLLYASTPSLQKRLPHLLFARSRLGSFEDFHDCLPTMRVFLDSNTASILLLTGESGGGKSSIMAAIVDEIHTTNDAVMQSEFIDKEDGIVDTTAPTAINYLPQVFFHFVGCNSASTFVLDFLQRLYFEFTELVNKVDPTYQMKAVDDLLVDANSVFPEIIRVFHELNDKLPPFIIVIDAINQMIDEVYNDNHDITSFLTWLPLAKDKEIPKKMKILISCLQTNPMFTELTAEKKNHKCELLIVNPLQLEQRRKVVYRWHELYSKVVDPDIMSPIWEYEPCSNPMFLSFMMKELIVHGTYLTLSKDRDELLHAQTVPELLTIMVNRLKAMTIIGGVPCPMIIDSILKYIYCSREGLTSAELFELVKQDLALDAKKKQTSKPTKAIDNDEKITVEISSTFWNTLVSYSMQHLVASRHGLLNFSHDFVRQAIESSYFCSGSLFTALESNNHDESNATLLQEAKERKRVVHKRLSIFFEGLSAVDDTTLTKADEYPRTMREVTFQQRMAGARPSVVVAARLRPFNTQELNENSSTNNSSCVRMKGKQVMLVDPQTTQDTRYSLDFAFDSCHPDGPDQQAYAGQERVFHLCGEDVLNQTLDGYNVSVFAYGQTGSGKSYTMFGTASDPGLIPRTLKELFRQLDLRQKQRLWTWTATATMVEIYLEQVYDLLADDKSVGNSENDDNSKPKKKSRLVHIRCIDAVNGEVQSQPVALVESSDDNNNDQMILEELRSISNAREVSYDEEAVGAQQETETTKEESKESNTTAETKKAALHKSKSRSKKTAVMNVSLVGATSLPVRTEADIEAVLTKGNQARTTKATKMNDTSSRSHCVLTLTVKQTHIATGLIKHSKVHLVDLAGSERGKKSGHLTVQLRKEAVAINRSLMVLNACFRALSDKSIQHVPYRDSPLTWLLQDSLGGNAKTVLLTTLSPAASNHHETQSTLRYATLAKKMPNNMQASLDDQALQAEAEKMRRAEMAAKEAVCEKYGFSESHLDLLREYYAEKGDFAFSWGAVATATWTSTFNHWEQDVANKYAASRLHQNTGPWVRKFRAKCTDASEQRYLKVKPGEKIACEMIYTFERMHDTCIAQFQLTIDLQHPVIRVEQICHQQVTDRAKNFTLIAPNTPGLYMIWTRMDLMYNHNDAENNMPKELRFADSFHNGFVAFVRVSEQVVSHPPGDWACFM